MFVFTNYAWIPEHFFGQGSKSFLGAVQFRGDPLRGYTDQRTGKKYSPGSADTVVVREQDVTIKGTSGSSTTPIELVALSLTSTKPIEVDMGHRKHKWHVRLTLSKSKRSTGTMTITQTSANGGVYASELNVVPLFTFVGQGGEEKPLDFGQMEIPREKAPLFKQLTTLTASDVAWELGPEEAQQGAEAPAASFVIPELVSHFPHLVVQVKGIEQQ